MRFDYFIIWGNGVNHYDEIINMIKIDSNFDIVLINKFPIETDMETFIKKIYESDTVPWDHLIAKSRYLLRAKLEFVFILTINKSPDEKYFGSGAFRHIQCQKVKDLKTNVRNRYNPPFTDINKQLLPLDKGVSHEHVVHGSDYESQVSHILNLLNLNSLEFYKTKYGIN
jgi:hypothetical protein